MSDKKHIDRLFQEHFKDFEATPSNAVWKNIEAELNQDKKKRRIIPIWWQYAGVAALLALLLTIGGAYFFNKENTNPIKVVDTEDVQTRSSNPSNDTKIAVENDNAAQNNLENDSQNNTKVASNTTEEPQEPSTVNSSSIVNTSSSTNKNKSTHQSGIASNIKSNVKNNITTPNNNAIASNSEEKNKSTNTAVTNNSENKSEIPQNKESLINAEKAKELINNASKDNTAIAKAEKEKNSLTIEEALDSNKDVNENEKNTTKWRITPNAAPVYFNSLGEGSSIDPQFNSNSKTGDVNMSYGISASYVVNNKIKVRSGVNKVNLGYNTNNVIVYQSFGISSNKRALQNVNASTSNASDNLSIISGETLNSKPEAFATTNTSINQALGYIEVPLEIEYALINNKLGINLVGGFSSFFLSDNKIFSEAESGVKTYLGEANNINKVSYSANFGVGFNYQVSKKIDLNLEPMFKYQINTFNNTSGNFTPFFIGVYTGFAIKF